MAESQEHNKKTPRDWLRLLCRRLRLLLLGASLFAVVTLLCAQYVPVKYTAEAKLERRNKMATEGLAKNKNDSFEATKLTLQLDLAGRDAVKGAVEDLHLTKGLPHGSDGRLTDDGLRQEQEIVQKLMTNLKVSWDARSDMLDVISVSFTSENPELAHSLPNCLISRYIEKAETSMLDRLKDTNEFLKGKVQDCTGTLQTLNKKKIAFETRYAGMFPDSPGALEKEIQVLTADMDTLRRQQTLAKEKLSRLKVIVQAATGPASQPTQVVKGPNPELKRLQDQLRESQQELETALTVRGMKEKHETVVGLRKKIAQLEQRISETPEEAVLQTVYSGTMTSDEAMQIAATTSELDVAERELDRLATRLKDAQTLMSNFGVVRQDYLSIVKELQDKQSEATVWQQRLADAQITLAAETAKKGTLLLSIQASQPPIRPSFPTLWMILGFAFGGGLAFGAALVFLANAMDHSIATMDDAARHFDVPIHGAVGEIVSPSLLLRRRLSRWVLTPAISLIVLTAIGATSLNVMKWLHYSVWK